MSDFVRRVQRAYPQLFHACHVEHATRRRSHGLSDRDASLLGHLDARAPVGAGNLAKHMGVGAPTLTEAIDRLEAQGLVDRTRRGRTVELRITKLGIERMQEASLLDTDRVSELIAAVPARGRAAAVRGIELLADAAARMMTGARRANRSF